jgi:hypothetical protein
MRTVIFILGLISTFLLSGCSSMEIEAPPVPLGHCDPSEYSLTEGGSVPLRKKGNEAYFVYEGGRYTIYIVSTTLLKRIESRAAWETNLSWIQQPSDSSKLLQQMRLDIAERGEINLKRYREIGANVAFDLRVLVGELVEDGDIAVVDELYWCRNDFCPRVLTSVSKQTITANNKYVGMAFCDPAGGEVFFVLPRPVVF